jgi:hypothetical protein
MNFLKYLGSYFKGFAELILILLLGLIIILGFLLFSAAYNFAVLVIVIVGIILILPYFFGKKYEKERPGKYKLKKIRG